MSNYFLVCMHCRKTEGEGHGPDCPTLEQNRIKALEKRLTDVEKQLEVLEIYVYRRKDKQGKPHE